MVKRGRLGLGTILQVLVDNRPAYLHYIGKRTDYGDAVRVFGYDEPPGDTVEFDKISMTGYVIFYPATAAVNKGLAKVIGQKEVKHSMPNKMRRPGFRTRSGQILTWIIEDNGTESVTKNLSGNQKKLDLAVMWNHEMLCQRIREAWRPENET